MAKPPTKQQVRSWIIYHIAAKLKFVGTIHDAPDGRTAIKRATEECRVPPKERGKLVALRRD